MIRRFFRHLLESMKSLKRNGWMSISSISAVAITLSLLAIFAAIILNAVKLADDMENNVDVSVFVVTGANDDDKKELEKELKAIDHVKMVTFSSKDNQLEKIKGSYGKSWDLFEQDNPLHDVYIVSATDPQYVKSITAAAKKLTTYVQDARYGDDLSDKIFSIAKGVRTWGLVGSIMLLFIAMFLISNTIRITILSRQREIQIMRLVGAKNSYIRWPLFLEGGWIGLLGAVIPVLIIVFGYQKFYAVANPIMLRSNYSLVTPNEFMVPVAVGVLLIGVMIGSIGSVISMRRFLKV
ncbi:permease-like cell division protein FtsX [uncultured Enterococcus sp.]|uniref:permease-like cell division protein FtsX n=1 Tax=uncultured Enterococcus sp. TaxID=167972 RepID=UPI002592466B|nr:permease-like cell division protein FtsX [uncultured Enterococcus sp.]